MNSARALSSTVDTVTPTSLTVIDAQTKKTYQFDKVFDEPTSQQEIFDYMSSCVASFVQGYNVSIMAYGQSGSGKSYTMGTSEDMAAVNHSQSMGIIARCAKLLYSQISPSPSTTPTKSGLRPPSSLTVKGNKVVKKPEQPTVNTKSSPYSVSVTYLEIYNEKLRDLLASGSAAKPLTIREDVKGEISVAGLNEVVVDSAQSLLKLLHKGSAARQVSSTDINSQSSRSHAIFTIHLTAKKHNAATGITTTITSKLNIVDLAGSERLKNTGVTDGRVKEGISINAGLAVLGKVISQLSQNHSHISYRDSKLTRILQDSLGGKAITYLIACITTDPHHVSETLNTLSYAQRARSIQSSPEIQKSETFTQTKEELTNTIHQLQQELAFYRNGSGPSNRNSIYSESSPLSSPVTKQLSSFELDSRPDSTRERINRSSVFHQSVRQVMGQYDDTIASLQTTIGELKLADQEKDQNISRLTADFHDLYELNELYKDRIAYLETQITQLKSHFSPAIPQQPDWATSISPNQSIDSAISGRDDNHEGDSDDGATISRLESEIRSMHAEILAHRKEQRSHLSESQYLTTQYNKSRREAEKLRDENEHLKAQLKRLSGNTEADLSYTASPPEPHTPGTIDDDHLEESKASNLQI